MTGYSRGFGPEDLPPASEVSAPELADSLRVGRELDAYAAAERVEPRSDFTTRVMGTIALEPTPRPAVVAGRAFRRGRPLALVGALGDAWRVAFSGGRPIAARAQALAFVLVAAIGIGSIGGLVGVGAGALLNRGDLAPTPGPSPAIPSRQPSPSVSPSPSMSPSPSASPSATPTESPTRTPDATPKTTARPTDTAEPTDTPEPAETPKPGETPRPSDHSGPG